MVKRDKWEHDKSKTKKEEKKPEQRQNIPQPMDLLWYVKEEGHLLIETHSIPIYILKIIGFESKRKMEWKGEKIRMKWNKFEKGMIFTTKKEREISFGHFFQIKIKNLNTRKLEQRILGKDFD